MYSFFNENKSSQCLRINLLNDKLRDHSDSSKFQSCRNMVHYLEEESNLLRNEEYRKSFNSNKLRVIDCIIKVTFCSCGCSQVIDSRTIVENLFRSLRNACVHNANNQRGIVTYEKMYSTLVNLVYGMLLRVYQGPSNEDRLVALRCGVQFLGNLSAGNDAPKAIVWKTLMTDLNLVSMLGHSDSKIRRFSCMTFFNCLSEPVRKEFLSNDEKSPQVINKLLSCFKNDEIEWSLYSMEFFIEDEIFMDKVYSKLELMDRHIVMDIILERFAKHIANYVCRIPAETVLFLVDNLIKMVKFCLNKPSNQSVEDLDPVETMKHFEALCYASLLPEFSDIIKKNSYLLELLLLLLKTVHFLGKEGKNDFSPIENLRSLTEQDENIAKSPFYGLKCVLIRLIANMCHESQTNQNIVRETSGIELILDCCNLDARNPFIIQWCILAVRNLMQNNFENQQTLARLSQSGSFSNSPLLDELGINVVENGGTFSLQTNKNVF